jgi:hypothetical protein
LLGKQPYQNQLLLFSPGGKFIRYYFKKTPLLPWEEFDILSTDTMALSNTAARSTKAEK